MSKRFENISIRELNAAVHSACERDADPKGEDTQSGAEFISSLVTEGHSPKPDLTWQLLKAAENAKRVLSDAEEALHKSGDGFRDDYAGLVSECHAAVDYLRDVITAYKEAKDEMAS